MLISLEEPVGRPRGGDLWQKSMVQVRLSPTGELNYTNLYDNTLILI